MRRYITYQEEKIVSLEGEVNLYRSRLQETESDVMNEAMEELEKREHASNNITQKHA